MQALNDRRRQFVRLYVTRGKRNATQAYVDAGYTCSNRDVARTNGCLMLHNENVQKAIKEYALQQLVALAPVAVATAGDILENEQVDPAVRVRLLMGIMDRTGMASQTEHKVTVEHISQDPRLLSEAKALVRQLNLTNAQAESLLGRSIAAQVLDVEFEDIPPSEDEEVRF